MNPKLSSGLLLGVLFLARTALCQGPTSDLKSALAPLLRFEGTWEKRFTIYKSAWSPEEIKKTGTISCKWILDGSHLQEFGRDSDGATYLAVHSFDASTNSFQAAVFQSSGNHWQISGKWDAASKTFSWSHDVGNGIQMVSKYQFIKQDEFKFSYIAAKGSSEYFRIEGTEKRIDVDNKVNGRPNLGQRDARTSDMISP